MVTVDTAHIPETDGQILITTEQPPPRRFEEDQDRVLSIWLSTR
jgi:hypothetical protein